MRLSKGMQSRAVAKMWPRHSRGSYHSLWPLSSQETWRPLLWPTFQEGWTIYSSFSVNIECWKREAVWRIYGGSRDVAVESIINVFCCKWFLMAVSTYTTGVRRAGTKLIVAQNFPNNTRCLDPGSWQWYYHQTGSQSYHHSLLSPNSGAENQNLHEIARLDLSH